MLVDLTLTVHTTRAAHAQIPAHFARAYLARRALGGEVTSRTAEGRFADVVR